MSALARCGVDNCKVGCIQGAADSVSCQECNEKHCNPDFEKCSGLNIQIAHPVPLDLVPIILGVVGGSCALLLLFGLCAYCDRKRNRGAKNLSLHDLARMANAQSVKDLVPIGPDASNPKYRSQATLKTDPSTVPSVQQPQQPQLTPYQMQYQAQQAAIAQGHLSTGRLAPSARASQMAAAAILSPPDLKQTLTPLVATYDFVAERPDELNVTVGTKLFGIEQQDGWWLARTEKGVVGLIPANYTETVVGVNVAIEPDF